MLASKWYQLMDTLLFIFYVYLQIACIHVKRSIELNPHIPDDLLIHKIIQLIELMALCFRGATNFMLIDYGWASGQCRCVIWLLCSLMRTSHRVSFYTGINMKPYRARWITLHTQMQLLTIHDNELIWMWKSLATRERDIYCKKKKKSHTEYSWVSMVQMNQYLQYHDDQNSPDVVLLW